MPAPGESFHLMLRIKGPGLANRVEDLVRDRYTVGRGDPSGAVQADFAIPEDEFLSRAHCRLHKTGETYAVENLSPNGTRLNGKALDKIVPLKHKDKIELGQATVLEFLAETGEERARDLQVSAGGKDARKAPAKKKPFWQRPIVLVMLGVYGVIGVVFLTAGGGKPAPAADPGDGPYLQWMLKAPLQWENDPEMRKKQQDAMWDAKAAEHTAPSLRDAIAQQAWDAAKGREAIAESMRRERARAGWKEALRQHGGDALASGPHAYYLLLAALDVLGLEGYANFAAAIDNKDDVAKEAAKVLNDPDHGFEKRLHDLHTDAEHYTSSRQWKPARETYERILDAVPSRNEPLQRFAAARLEELKGRK